MAQICNLFPEHTCEIAAFIGEGLKQRASELCSQAVEYGKHSYAQLPSAKELGELAKETAMPYIPNLSSPQTQNMMMAGLLVTTFTLSTYILYKAAGDEIAEAVKNVYPVSSLRSLKEEKVQMIEKAIVPVKEGKEDKVIETNKAIVPVKKEEEEEIIEINTADFAKNEPVKETPKWELVNMRVEVTTPEKVDAIFQGFEDLFVSMLLLPY